MANDTLIKNAVSRKIKGQGWPAAEKKLLHDNRTPHLGTFPGGRKIGKNE